MGKHREAGYTIPQVCRTASLTALIRNSKTTLLNAKLENAGCRLPSIQVEGKFTDSKKPKLRSRTLKPCTEDSSIIEEEEKEERREEEGEKPLSDEMLRRKRSRTSGKSLQ